MALIYRQSYMGPAGGGGGTDPWITLDGRLNAPSGTPQFPTILNQYPTVAPPSARQRWPTNPGVPGSLSGYPFTQPPWQVAGVDYYVGIDRTLYPTLPTPGVSSGSLKDATNQTLLDSTFGTGNVTVGTNSNLGYKGVTVNNTATSPVVFEGWDFSQGGGYGILNDANSSPYNGDIKVNNCYFQMGTNGVGMMRTSASTSGNYTVTNCIFNGNQQTDTTSGTGVCIFFGGGNVVLKYNYFTQWAGNAFKCTASSTSPTLDARYNLIYQGNWTNDEHCEAYQIGFGWGQNTVNFNTCYQPDGSTATGLPGSLNSAYSSVSNVNNANIGPCDSSNNTVLGIGDNHASFWGTGSGTSDGANPSTVSGIANTATLDPGNGIDGVVVYGTGVPSGTKITSHTATTVLLDHLVTAGAVTLTSWNQNPAFNAAFLFGNGSFVITSANVQYNYVAFAPAPVNPPGYVGGGSTMWNVPVPPSSFTHASNIDLSNGSTITYPTYP